MSDGSEEDFLMILLLFVYFGRNDFIENQHNTHTDPSVLLGHNIVLVTSVIAEESCLEQV